MKKLDLSEYTDKEITTALFELPAHKFLPVIGAMGESIERTHTRGRTISQSAADDHISALLKMMEDDDANSILG